MLWFALVVGTTTVVAASVGSSLTHLSGQLILGDQKKNDFQCDLPPVLDPSSDGLPSSKQLFLGKAALMKQVERHAAIVQIPGISYDDSGAPGGDPVWDIFYDIHDKLEELYPLFHGRASREMVNTFGLVYTIKGSDESLKPIMLAAHQDVVPVADASTWQHPPFSGHFDGKWLWGRGASDDKNALTALFSALEGLLTIQSWTPKRTIIVALGFDEECTGYRGAAKISPYLEELWGKNSMALIVDEGGMGLELIGDTLYALPATTEKAHVDVWMDLKVNGGHSSIPLPHTGIGIMSEIVVQLESNPYKPKLIEGSPIHSHYICQARYSPDANPAVTDLINKGDLKALAEELVSINRPLRYRLQTSQAVDYVSGGIKINAMPEKIRIGVNHRIAPHESVATVQNKILNDIKPTVKKYCLALNAFKGTDFHSFTSADGGDYNGTLTLTLGQPTVAAPISPMHGKVWEVFSGSIRHTFAFPNGTVVPVGELMTGNTDTRHYLNLSKNIYRFAPVRQGSSVNIHTVDERIDMFSHMEVVQFYYDLVRNFDASDA